MIKHTLIITSLSSLLLVQGCKEVLTDWETFQGNNLHTGYVEINLETADFNPLWQWERPNKSEGVTPYINPAIIVNGIVYISEDDYHSEAKIHALSEADGSTLWTHDFGSIAQVNQPAVSDGKVFVTTSGHEDTYMWVLDATTGSVLARTPFNTQWPQYLSPTVYDGIAYANTGYYGGQISAFDIDGNSVWESASYGDNDMFTPAVDRAGIYQYSGTELNVLNPIDGSLVQTIADPDPDGTGYEHIGATIRGTLNNVISFSGDNFSGQASSSTEGFFARRLISFDLTNETVSWKSESQYLTHPALAEGEVFAATNNPLRLESLSEASGELVWNWVPKNSAVSSFHRNIIATKTLIFVSSNVGIHAISRSNHNEEWFYPVPGALSLSAEKILYITEGFRQSNGTLHAISLK
jgi:outer membrane protein assembly factor BamB